MDKGEPQPGYCWDYHKAHMMGSGEQAPAVPWTNWMSLLSGTIIHDHAGKRTTFPTQSDTWPAQGWGDRMDWWSGHQVLNIFFVLIELSLRFCTSSAHSIHGMEWRWVGAAAGKHWSTCPQENIPEGGGRLRIWRQPHNLFLFPIMLCLHCHPFIPAPVSRSYHQDGDDLVLC